MDGRGHVVGRDEERLLERLERFAVFVQCEVVQPELEEDQSPVTTTEEGRLTCTQTAGLLWSRTSASWIAPLACSILPSLRNVAEDISHRLLSNLRSFASRAFWREMVGPVEGGGGGGGGGGASNNDKSCCDEYMLRCCRKWIEDAWYGACPRSARKSTAIPSANAPHVLHTGCTVTYLVQNSTVSCVH